jgi:hypothetical protein
MRGNEHCVPFPRRSAAIAADDGRARASHVAAETEAHAYALADLPPRSNRGQLHRFPPPESVHGYANLEELIVATLVAYADPQSGINVSIDYADIAAICELDDESDARKIVAEWQRDENYPQPPFAYMRWGSPLRGIETVAGHVLAPEFVTRHRAWATWVVDRRLRRLAHTHGDSPLPPPAACARDAAAWWRRVASARGTHPHDVSDIVPMNLATSMLDLPAELFERVRAREMPRTIQHAGRNYILTYDMRRCMPNPQRPHWLLDPRTWKAARRTKSGALRELRIGLTVDVLRRLHHTHLDDITDVELERERHEAHQFGRSYPDQRVVIIDALREQLFRRARAESAHATSQQMHLRLGHQHALKEGGAGYGRRGDDGKNGKRGLNRDGNEKTLEFPRRASKN